jgi:hypothetical protein
VAGVAAARTQQDDQPRGGGQGCKSRGTCEGTLYSNRLNLDSWWYEICSGCHVVQAPRPSDARPTLTQFQRSLVGDRPAFWRFHADAQADPVLRRLTPTSRLRRASELSPPYSGLMPK